MLNVYKAVPAILDLSIFVPFTRLWLVDEFLDNFDKIDNVVSPSNTELVFFNDTDSIELDEKLLAYFEKRKDKFGGMTLYTSGKPLLDELGDNNHIKKRRQRIVDMKNKSRELIGDSYYIFCLEDDTFVEPHAIGRLMRLCRGNVGLASGVEMSRWGYKIIGAWEIEPIEDPTKVTSVPFKETGLQNVDSTGWYCYITKTRLYKEATYHFDAECLGPDVCYGWDLRKQGWEVLINWDNKCYHKSHWGDFYPSKDAKVVTYTKTNEVWTNTLK